MFVIVKYLIGTLSQLLHSSGCIGNRFKLGCIRVCINRPRTPFYTHVCAVCIQIKCAVLCVPLCLMYKVDTLLTSCKPRLSPSTHAVLSLLVLSIRETYKHIFPSHTLVNESSCSLPCVPVPPGKRLTAQLACLRCAKTHCREFIASTGSLKELFTNAMHHADEQVVKEQSIIMSQLSEINDCFVNPCWQVQMCDLFQQHQDLEWGCFAFSAATKSPVNMCAELV